MNAADERRSARTNVVMSATVEWGPHRVPVRIRNLSAHGALVVGNGLPSAETDVIFHFMGKTISGWLPWSRDGTAGVAFGEAVEPRPLARTSSNPHPLIVRDMRKLDCRRPGFRGRQLSDEEALIVEQWTRANSRLP